MSVGLLDAARRWDASRLRERGFTGFHSVSHLMRTRCLEVPVERGVYVVVRDTDAPPEFRERSVGGRYRHEDPSVAVEDLAKRWVAGARVLYIGGARGPGVRSLLQQRVKRYLRFGQGKAVGHRGGRYVWQLLDHIALQIAWLTTPDADPAALAAEVLDGFSAHHGRPPFANLDQEEQE